MRRGVVNWFSGPLGYGFVIDRDTNLQAFVWWRDIVTPTGDIAREHEHWPERERLGHHLRERQLVDYELVQTDKGPRAVNVRAVPVVASDVKEVV